MDEKGFAVTRAIYNVGVLARRWQESKQSVPPRILDHNSSSYLCAQIIKRERYEELNIR